jgi:pimeloyl-ACP methyl ester carboxylesterase
MRYYNGAIKPEYMEFVRIQYGQLMSEEWPLLARIRAWQQGILYFDPVVYDWQHIETKAILLGGQDDRLSPGFAERSQYIAETLPNADIHQYPGIGHNPHLDLPEEYHADLVAFLNSDPDTAATDW